MNIYDQIEKIEILRGIHKMRDILEIIYDEMYTYYVKTDISGI